jgi:hypothetical protein
MCKWEHGIMRKLSFYIKHCTTLVDICWQGVSIKKDKSLCRIPQTKFFVHISVEISSIMRKKSFMVCISSIYIKTSFYLVIHVASKQLSICNINLLWARDVASSNLFSSLNFVTHVATKCTQNRYISKVGAKVWIRWCNNCETNLSLFNAINIYVN